MPDLPPDAPAAFALHREFPAAKRETIRFDRHYFLYAVSGTMRLEDEGRVWVLPPARAAWIAAGEPIHITIPRGITAASVLFDPAVFARPAHPLRVIEMSELARNLVRSVRGFGPETPATPLSESLFQSLALVAEEAARAPSQAWQPLGRSGAVQKALMLTEAQLAEAPSFETIARETGLSSRALARKFEAELGLTWRQAQRRMRMVKAMELLADQPDLPVTEVALEVGYNSLSAFNAAFREQTDLTPTGFRQRGLR